MSGKSLLQRAQALHFKDDDINTCWNMITQAIEVGWIDSDDIKEIIEQGSERVDYGSEEFFLESIGGRLRVRFLDDVHFCEPQEMIQLLLSITEDYKK